MTKKLLLFTSLTFSCSMSAMNSLDEKEFVRTEQGGDSSSSLKQHCQNATTKLNKKQAGKHVSLLAQAMLNDKSLLWALD